MTEIVIERTPTVKYNLLDATRELKGGIDELVSQAESLLEAVTPSPAKISSQFVDDFGQFGRQMTWCRMYAAELSGREDSKMLPSIADYASGQAGFNEVQWIFCCSDSLDRLQDWCGKKLFRIAMAAEDSRSVVNILLSSIRRLQQSTNLLVGQLVSFSQRGLLPESARFADRARAARNRGKLLGCVTTSTHECPWFEVDIATGETAIEKLVQQEFGLQSTGSPHEVYFTDSTSD